MWSFHSPLWLLVAYAVLGVAYAVWLGRYKIRRGACICVALFSRIGIVIAEFCGAIYKDNEPEIGEVSFSGGVSLLMASSVILAFATNNEEIIKGWILVILAIIMIAFGWRIKKKQRKNNDKH